VNDFKVDKVVTKLRQNVFCVCWSEGGNQRLWFCDCNWCFYLHPSHIGRSCVKTNTRSIQTSGSFYLYPRWSAELCFCCNWTRLLMYLLKWFPVWPHFALLNGHCVIFNGFGWKTSDIWLKVGVCLLVCGLPGSIVSLPKRWIWSSSYSVVK